MQTVPETPRARKPQAFYAHFHGLSGVITRPAEAVLFLEPESGAVVTLSEADYPELVVLGAVNRVMAQYIEDMARGGAAFIACRRAMEVA